MHSREVHELIRQNAADNSIDHVRAMCAATFPRARMPAASTVGRLMLWERGRGARSMRGRLRRNPAQLAFLVDKLREGPATRAVAEFSTRFPDAGPVSRHLARTIRRDVLGDAGWKRGPVPPDPALVAFVRKNVDRMTVNELHAAVAARFPGRPAPARSTLLRLAGGRAGREA